MKNNYYYQWICRVSRIAALCGIVISLGTGSLLAQKLDRQTGSRNSTSQNTAGNSRAASTYVYDDSLQSPFEDWSYGTTVNLANVDPVNAGTNSIAVTHNDAWSGFYLGSSSDVEFGDEDELAIFIHGGQGGQLLRLYYVNSSYDWIELVDVQPLAGQWNEVIVDFPQFGTPDVVRGFVFQEFNGGAANTYYVDDFRCGDFVPEEPNQPQNGPAILVNLGETTHVISNDIYGLNFADKAFAAEIGLPVNRWGGNATSRYNWELDSTNLASDWFFENYPSETVDPSLLPVGSTADYFVSDNLDTGTNSIITVGLMDWVANSRDITGSFPVDVYGEQQSVDPYRPNIGNGVRTDGSLIDVLDRTVNNKRINHKYSFRRTTHLVSQFGQADEGGVKFYALGNEPMLWNSTHRDVHPEPAGYEEVVKRSYSHSAAIKAADPSAQTMGPASWGWTAYFFSALDQAAGGAWWENPQNRNRHGGLPFLAYYLKQMQEDEIRRGERLLDYLDIHYYPQGNGIALAPVGDVDTQQRRLLSTRSLWDDNYVDDSWINEEVRLIPLMKEWIDKHYAGTKLALTEYNWGAIDHINGAVTQADVLGILGREGVDLATMWDPPTTDQPVAFAFRMFRNYDGQQNTNSRFGESGLSALSSDSDAVSVFAAQRASDDSTTIVLINKTLTPLDTPVDLPALSGSVMVERYQYDASTIDAIVQQPDLEVVEGQVQITLPPYSITLLELPAGN